VRDTSISSSLLQTWAALITVSLGLFAITLDGSMMPVAIGSIVNGLNTEVGFVQAAMALHSLVMASAYLAAGKLAAGLGEKRIFVIGALIFAMGTVIAAMSPNVWILLLGWSLIKPIGGAMMIPPANSLIVLNYEGEQRTLAFGIFSAFVAAAAVIGPLWMGFMAATLSWRWAFASEPLLIFFLLYFASMVKESEELREMKFDIIGAILTFFGLALIVLGATLAGEYGWWQARRPFYISESVFAPFGLSPVPLFILSGAVVLAVFAFWSTRQSRRGGVILFHLDLFKNRIFSYGTLLGFMFQLTASSFLFVLPVYLQSALQLTALETGLVLLPYTLGIFLFALSATRLPATFQVTRIIQAGLLLMLVGSFWVHSIVGYELNWGALIPSLFCFGAGCGIVLSRLTEITLSNVQPAELSEATGGDSTGKELGVAFGVAIMGSIFLILVYGGIVDSYDKYHDLPTISSEERVRAIVELEDWAAKISHEDWQIFLDSQPEFTRNVYQSMVEYSFLAGYKTILKVLIVIIAFMFLISLSLPRSNPLQVE
jgi:MFS family permease